jgi:V/A-type H+-transporting ATPase subunit F
MAEARIAAFGDSDIMLIFKAMGADVYTVESTTGAEDAEDLLKKIIKGGYGIIFMTEAIAAELDSTVKYYSTRITPSIVVIPGMGKRNNYAIDQLRTAIIKAVGADVMAEGVQNDEQE